MVRDHEHDTDGIALDERVSSLLSAAAAPSEPGPLPGEGAALAAFRAAQPQPRRSPHRSVLVAARSGMAAAMAGLLLTGGVAAATAGVLPGIAQDTVDGVLVDLGLSPADDASPERLTGTETSETAATSESSVPAADDPGEAAAGEDTAEGAGSDHATAGDVGKTASVHGKEVSRTARETEATGAAKGAEISGLASQGRSRTGEGRQDERRPGTAHTARTRPSGAAAAARLRAERSAASRAPGTHRRPAGAGRP